MSDETPVSTDLEIRAYVDHDEPEVLDLVRGSLGGGPAGERPPEYFRWKHLENPFGRSFMIVAESEGRIVGFRALMRWRFSIGDQTIEAVRPVDTVTHPDMRGQGIFSKLTRTALDSLHGEIDLVFNTPNQNSLPGYVKMGWQVVGEVPVWIRICRPARFASWKLRRSRSSDAVGTPRPAVEAPTASEALVDGGAVADLIARAEVPSWGYSTPRSVEHLRWRYGDAPLLGYHAVLVGSGDRLEGMCFFRLRREGPLWGSSIADLLVAPGDEATAHRLLVAARRSADVSYLAATFPKGTAADRAYRRPLTVKAPRGMTLVANPLGSDLRPDPLLFDSWALSTGEVEVF
jgi:GNAT superfamily N-acetyltransferase